MVADCHIISLRDFALLCFDNRKLLPSQASSVVPVAFVFLDRWAADSPQLKHVNKDEMASLLWCSLTFLENRRFDYERREVVRALAELPAYHLAYPADPRLAAQFSRPWSFLSAKQGHPECVLVSA